MREEGTRSPLDCGGTRSRRLWNLGGGDEGCAGWASRGRCDDSWRRRSRRDCRGSGAWFSSASRLTPRRDWHGSRSDEFQREPINSRQVCVKPDALDPADPKHRQRVIVLQRLQPPFAGAWFRCLGPALTGLTATSWPYQLPPRRRAGLSLRYVSLTGGLANATSGTGRHYSERERKQIAAGATPETLASVPRSL
jgi:hypothetical protein